MVRQVFRNRDHIDAACRYYMGLADEYVDKKCLWGGRQWTILSSAVFGFRSPDYHSRYDTMTWGSAIAKCVIDERGDLLREWEKNLKRLNPKDQDPVLDDGIDNVVKNMREIFQTTLQRQVPLRSRKVENTINPNPGT